jgi:thiol-disulfide isomerase/thioredoxin
MDALKKILLAIALLFSVTSSRGDSFLHPFTVTSLADIHASNAGKPFILLFWSLDCASCIKEMDGLAVTMAKYPELRLVLVATDDIADSDQVQTVLTKHHLQSVDSWVFADSNVQKLRYRIDPSWFGELPRVYFYNAVHERQAQSGLLKPEQIDAWMNSMNF